VITQNLTNFNACLQISYRSFQIGLSNCVKARLECEKQCKECYGNPSPSSVRPASNPNSRQKDIAPHVIGLAAPGMEQTVEDQIHQIFQDISDIAAPFIATGQEIPPSAL